MNKLRLIFIESEFHNIKFQKINYLKATVEMKLINAGINIFCREYISSISFNKYLRLILIDFLLPLSHTFNLCCFFRSAIRKFIYRKRFAFLLFQIMNSALPFQNETGTFIF